MAQIDENRRHGDGSDELTGSGHDGSVSGEPRTGGRTGALLKLAVLALLLIGGYLAAARTPLGAYLTREGIGEAIELLRGNPWAPLIFMATYATATALAVPGTILTLAGGALFGFYWGTLFNYVAANIGANAAFVLARTLGGDGVRRLMGDDSAALRKLDRVVGKHGFRGVLTLRLIPLIPFNALNFGSGLVPLKWRTYAVATLAGILPGTAVYTFFADSLLQGSLDASRDALFGVLLAGGLLLLLSFLPAILKRLGVRLPGMSAVVVPLVGLSLAGRPASGLQDAAVPQLPDHSDFTRVLTAVVEGPLVNYSRLAADPTALNRYLATLASTDPSALDAANEEDRLAFWINAYNACMLKRVTEHYPIRRAGGLLRLRNAAAGRPENSVWQIADVFTGTHCPVAGADRSQDEIEHEIIRPMGDPRIHLAINCAALSCPPLISRAYLGDTLDRQLDERVIAFLRDPVHFEVSVTDGAPTVRINRVFDWFNEDFGGHEGILAFLAEYLDGADGNAVADPEAALVFFDYDWTLNDAPH